WSGWIPDGLSGFLPGEPQGHPIIQAGLSRGAKCKIISLCKMWLEDLTAGPTGSRASWPDFIGERTEDLLQRWLAILNALMGVQSFIRIMK
ncbi:MAG: hypothetical protein M0Z36_04100, partial [Thermaerobacter sp.]|nr:hypothetical protein [Thermaerobacter sp.]